MNASTYTISTTDSDQFLVALSGELDITSVQRFHEALHTCESQWSNRAVELDLAAVRYVDAAWLQALMSLQRTVNDLGQSFTLRNCPPALITQMERCGALGQLRCEARLDSTPAATN